VQSGSGAVRVGQLCGFVLFCARQAGVTRLSTPHESRAQLPAGRKSDLATYVDTVGEVTVHELTVRYGVSLDTIRRDLHQLHNGGRIVRTHGGAVSIAVHNRGDRGLTVRLHLQAAEKEAIAQMAATLVADSSVIILNAGTTALAVARALHNRRDLIIATNNLLLPEVISAKAFRELYMFGGSVRIITQGTTGPARFPTNKGQDISVRADLALVAVGAVAVEGGYTTSNLAEAVMMREMMQQSEKVAVMADSSKFDRRLFAQVADLGQADYFITDAPPPLPLRQALDDFGVTVLYPPVAGDIRNSKDLVSSARQVGRSPSPATTTE